VKIGEKWMKMYEKWWKLMKNEWNGWRKVQKSHTMTWRKLWKIKILYFSVPVRFLVCQLYQIWVQYYVGGQLNWHLSKLAKGQMFFEAVFGMAFWIWLLIGRPPEPIRQRHWAISSVYLPVPTYKKIIETCSVQLFIFLQNKMFFFQVGSRENLFKFFSLFKT